MSSILLTLCIHKVGYRNHCISSLSFCKLFTFYYHLLCPTVSVLLNTPTPLGPYSGIDLHPPLPVMIKIWLKKILLSSFHSNIVGSFRTR